MLFSSIPFLFYFLPITLILYFLAPKCLKNTVLLIASLVFYGWGEPKYVFLMMATILVGFVAGLLIEKNRGKKSAKVYLTLAVTLFLAALGYFKYADFFIENFGRATGLPVTLLNIALPIGISFYTFQILSYTVDVYRGEAAQKNIVNLGAYITMFPQLIAGPIVRYSTINAELTHRSHSLSEAEEGTRRFILGLAKKILIANLLGEVCDIFKNSSQGSVLYFWLYAVSFMIHIYFDFSGYSDMAIGLGKIFGFHFLENFNYPYISRSITEFWRRWHMSLGTWFRDYVYIPLGGNRVGKGRWLANIAVVWFLTGFWHGADWTFMFWGLYFALFLVAEKLLLGRFLEKNRVISHIYTLLVVAVGFVLFNAESMGTFIHQVVSMFGGSGLPFVNAEVLYYLRSYGFILILGILGATPLPKMAVEKLRKIDAWEKVISILEPIVLLILLILMTAYLVDGSFNPFLYFRF